MYAFVHCSLRLAVAGKSSSNDYIYIYIYAPARCSSVVLLQVFLQTLQRAFSFLVFLAREKRFPNSASEDIQAQVVRMKFPVVGDPVNSKMLSCAVWRNAMSKHAP